MCFGPLNHVLLRERLILSLQKKRLILVFSDRVEEPYSCVIWQNLIFVFFFFTQGLDFLSFRPMVSMRTNMNITHESMLVS